MEDPSVLVLNHIYNRKMSYKSGVMICRSTDDGTLLGEKLSTLSMNDLEQINNNKTDHLNEKEKGLLKDISTSCRAMDHTKEAAKYARQNYCAMLDYNGLNRLFLSTTPYDECSFRVRLYGKPQNWDSPSFYSR